MIANLDGLSFVDAVAQTHNIGIAATLFFSFYF